MLAIQRIKSINAENGIDTNDPLAAMMWHWLYDEKKCLLPALSKLIDKIDETGDLKPLDYYNFIIVTTQFEELVGTVAAGYSNDADYPLYPNIEWLKGWEEE